MADLLGISQSTYKGYELVGETNGREPSIETIRLIVKILDISAGYLLGVEEI